MFLNVPVRLSTTTTSSSSAATPPSPQLPPLPSSPSLQYLDPNVRPEVYQQILQQPLPQADGDDGGSPLDDDWMPPHIKVRRRRRRRRRAHGRSMRAITSSTGQGEWEVDHSKWIGHCDLCILPLLPSSSSSSSRSYHSLLGIIVMRVVAFTHRLGGKWNHSVTTSLCTTWGCYLNQASSSPCLLLGWWSMAVVRLRITSGWLHTMG